MRIKNLREAMEVRFKKKLDPFTLETSKIILNFTRNGRVWLKLLYEFNPIMFLFEKGQVETSYKIS